MDFTKLSKEEFESKKRVMEAKLMADMSKKKGPVRFEFLDGLSAEELSLMKEIEDRLGPVPFARWFAKIVLESGDVLQEVCL